MEAVAWRPAEIPLAVACDAIGVSRATLYRACKPKPPREVVARPPSPRRISDDERRLILDTLTSPEFADQPPAEVFATLLSRGACVGRS